MSCREVQRRKEIKEERKNIEKERSYVTQIYKSYINKTEINYSNAD